MTKTGADFTNTFRDLSKVKKSTEMTAEDERAIEVLVGHSAPKEALLQSAKSPFES